MQMNIGNFQEGKSMQHFLNLYSQKPFPHLLTLRILLLCGAFVNTGLEGGASVA